MITLTFSSFRFLTPLLISLSFSASAASTPESEALIAKARQHLRTYTFESSLRGYLTLKEAAALGNPSAKAQLGELLESGIAVSPNTAEALRLYKEAAAANDPWGCVFLGKAHLNGFGVPRDPSLAATLVKQSLEALTTLSEEGDAHAQSTLGTLYAQGIGVPTNFRKAREFFTKAAAQDYAPGAFGLAYLHHIGGEGVPQDYSKAIFWYQKAAEQGFPNAYNHLGVLYSRGHGFTKSHSKAIEYYQKAADRNLKRAFFNLASAHANGEGFKKSPENAFPYYHMAAQLDHPYSAFILGFMYENGSGVPKDLPKARHWYQHAAHLGEEEAQKALSRFK